MTPPWPRGQRDRGHGRVPGALRPPRGAVGARHRGAPPVSPRRTALPSPPRPLPQHLPDRRLRARGQQDPGGSGPGHRPVPGFLPVLLRGLDQEEPPAHRALQVEHLQQHLGPEPGHHEAPPRWGAAVGTPPRWGHPWVRNFPPHMPRAEPRSSPLVQKTPASTRAARRRGRRSATTCPASRSSASRSWAHSPWWSSSTRWEARGPPGGSKCPRSVLSPPQLGDGCPPGGCSAGRSAAGTSAARGTRAASWRC